jgi:hypothetical protein
LCSTLASLSPWMLANMVSCLVHLQSNVLITQTITQEIHISCPLFHQNWIIIYKEIFDADKYQWSCSHAYIKHSNIWIWFSAVMMEEILYVLSSLIFVQYLIQFITLYDSAEFKMK